MEMKAMLVLIGIVSFLTLSDSAALLEDSGKDTGTAGDVFLLTASLDPTADASDFASLRLELSVGGDGAADICGAPSVAPVAGSTFALYPNLVDGTPLPLPLPDASTGDGPNYDSVTYELGAVSTSGPMEVTFRVCVIGAEFDGTVEVTAKLVEETDGELAGDDLTLTLTPDPNIDNYNDGPDFIQLTGENELMRNSTVKLIFSIHADFVTPNITFYAGVAEYGGQLSVESARVRSAGAYWPHLKDPSFAQKRFPATLIPFEDGIGNKRLTMPLGVQANTEARTKNDIDETESEIEIELVVHIYALKPLTADKLLVDASVAITGLNRSEIWTTYHDFTLIEVDESKYIEPTNLNTEFELERLSSADIRAGDSISTRLIMTLPQDTEGDYTIEVNMPTHNETGEALFSACAISLESQGFHVPYVLEMGLLTRLTFHADGGAFPARMSLPLGRVRNTGSTPEDQAHTAENQIRFLVTYTLRDGLSGLGDAEWAGVSVGYGGDEFLWTKLDNVEITHEDVLASASPQPAIVDFASSNSAAANQKVGFEIQASYAAESNDPKIMPKFQLDVTADFGVWEICEMRVVSAGQNLPCLQPWVAAGSTKAQLSPDEKPNVGLLDIGEACLLDLGEEDKDDEFRVRAVLRSLSGAAGDPEIKLAYGPDPSQVYTASFDEMTADDSAKPTFATPPNIVITTHDPKAAAEVQEGSATSMEVLLKFPPSESAADVTLELSVDEHVHFCNLSVLFVGDNLPCLILQDRHVMDGTQRLTLDLDSVVSNVGQSPPLDAAPTRDDNTIALLLVVRAEGVAATATATISAKLTYQKGEATGSGEITELIGEEKVFPSPTIVSFGFADKRSGTIEVKKGVLNHFRLELEVEADTSPITNVTFLGPLDKTGTTIEFCSGSVVRAGENLPCVQERATVPTLAAFNDSGVPNEAAFDLGCLCYANLAKPSFNFDGLSRLFIDVLWKLDMDTILVDNNLFVITAIVSTAGQDPVTQDSQQLKVLNSATAEPVGAASDSRLSVVLNTTALRPGEWAAGEVIFSIPPGSRLDATLTIEMAIDDTAPIHIRNVVVRHIGYNLHCITNDTNIVLSSDIIESSYDNKAVIEFGDIINTGWSYDQRTGYKDGDDRIEVLFDFMMTDSINSTNGHEFPLIIKNGDGLVSLSSNVTVARNGTEVAEIVGTVGWATLTEPVAGADLGTNFEIGIMLTHEWFSSAEAYNVTFTLDFDAGHFDAPYVSDTGDASSAVHASVADADSFSLFIERFMLTETLDLTLNFTVINDTFYNEDCRIFFPYRVSFEKRKMTIDTYSNFTFVPPLLQGSLEVIVDCPTTTTTTSTTTTVTSTTTTTPTTTTSTTTTSTTTTPSTTTTSTTTTTTSTTTPTTTSTTTPTTTSTTTPTTTTTTTPKPTMPAPTTPAPTVAPTTKAPTTKAPTTKAPTTAPGATTKAPEVPVTTPAPTMLPHSTTKKPPIHVNMGIPWWAWFVGGFGVSALLVFLFCQVNAGLCRCKDDDNEPAPYNSTLYPPVSH